MSDIPSAGVITLRLLSMEVARKTYDREVTPEHLFLALCELARHSDQDVDRLGARLKLPPVYLERLRQDRRVLKRAFTDAGLPPDDAAAELTALMGHGPDLRQETHTYHRTPECRAVYEAAERLAQTSGALSVEPLHILWALLETGNNRAVPLIGRKGLKPRDIIAVCQRLAGRRLSVEELRTSRPPEDAPDQAESQTPMLDRVGKDLTALAREGRLGTVVGMEQHVLHICQGLLRMDKGAVLLLGEPGVGKTAAAEAFACAIAQGTLPGVLAQRLGHLRVVEVPLGALVAGTSLRGQFEERVQTLLDEARQNLDRVVLFIDEIHLMMGAGSTRDGGMDVGNLLKPAMSRGEVRLIGATTPDECARYLEPDPAIMRRWEKVHVEEPDDQTTWEILTHLRPTLAAHYRLIIGDDALRACLELPTRYLHDRRQPARTLDILHETCAHMMCVHSAAEHWKDPTFTTPSPQRLTLTHRAVAELVARRARLPLTRVLALDDRLVQDTRAALEEAVFGQPRAIEAVMGVIMRAAQGLTEPTRPDGVMLLVGPAGSGRATLTRAVAGAMFGQRQDRLLTLDLAEYSDPGRVSRLTTSPPTMGGPDPGGALTEPVRRQPCAVVLLENVDRTHPEVRKLLTWIFDQGHVEDGQGRRVDFSNTLIFMTATAPLEDHTAQQLQRRVGADLLHHIDVVVPFAPPDRQALDRIAREALARWRERLETRGVHLALTPQARDLLLDAGQQPEHGPRHLQRAIEQGVLQALARRGMAPGHVTIDARDGGFVALDDDALPPTAPSNPSKHE